MSFHLAGVGLTHTNGHLALKGVTLDAEQGESLALIGPSGAGKTTLLRLLGAALRPTAGEIKLLGHEVWSLSTSRLRGLRASIGIAHQVPPLPPRQRVVTAVLAGRLGQWPLWKGIASLIYPMDIQGCREALARFNLSDRIFDRCDRLSGGQLQRVGLARILYQQPRLILADEPVSALDPALSRQAIDVLTATAKERGATLVCSLHSVDRALSCFPRVIGLRAGQVVFDLPPNKINEAMLRDLYEDESVERRYRLPVIQVGKRAGDFKPRQTAIACPGLSCQEACQ